MLLLAICVTVSPQLHADDGDPALPKDSDLFSELIDAGFIESDGEQSSESDREQSGSDMAQSSEVNNTLAELESMALASHPAINAARSAVEAARGRYVQAGIGFNPVVEYQGEEIGDAGTAGFQSVRISQQYVTADKLGLAQQVQAQLIQRQQAEMHLVELQVLTNVRTAFSAALVAQRRVELTAAIVDLAEESLKSVQALLDAQEVSRVSLLQARVEVTTARIVAENAATQLMARRRVLAAAAGTELTAGPVMGELDDGMTDESWGTFVDRITVGSPELASAGSELQRARWALCHAYAMATPNITGQVGVGLDTLTDDTYAVVSVSVPLPIRNKNQGGIRAARADVAAASAAIDSTRLDLESRLADAVGRYKAARERHERLRDGVLPDAEETYALSLEAFEAGESDYLQLMASQRTLISTQLRVLEAIGVARESMAQIEGMLVTLRK